MLGLYFLSSRQHLVCRKLGSGVSDLTLLVGEILRSENAGGFCFVNRKLPPLMNEKGLEEFGAVPGLEDTLTGDALLMVAIKLLLCNRISYAVLMDLDCAGLVYRLLQFRLSNTPAAPIPPPTHIVTSP